MTTHGAVDARRAAGVRVFSMIDGCRSVEGYGTLDPADTFETVEDAVVLWVRHGRSSRWESMY